MLQTYLTTKKQGMCWVLFWFSFYFFGICLALLQPLFDIFLFARQWVFVLYMGWIIFKFQFRFQFRLAQLIPNPIFLYTRRSAHISVACDSGLLCRWFWLFSKMIDAGFALAILPFSLSLSQILVVLVVRKTRLKSVHRPGKSRIDYLWLFLGVSLSFL